MKHIIVAILALSMTGCGIPSAVYHGVKTSTLRGKALTLNELERAASTTEERARDFSPVQFEQVVVLARSPQDAVQPRGMGYAVQSSLAPSRRQVIESVFLQSLLRRGYRGASRMNLAPIHAEAIMPGNGGDGTALGGLFQGERLLLINLNAFELTPVRYDYRTFLTQQQRQAQVGTRVVAHLTAELLDIKSSQSLWAASERIDSVLKHTPAELSVLELVTSYLAQRIPASIAPATSRPLERYNQNRALPLASGTDPSPDAALGVGGTSDDTFTGR